MGKCSVSYLLILLFLSFIWGSQLAFSNSGVTYDNKSIVINGQRKILISGSIHYPRSTPEYYFEDRYDLVKFIKTVQSVGLYVNLRIGPYVCAEWNFGGFPVWLKYVPGISFRTDNEPFKRAMQSFTQKIVQMMQSGQLFASQGGPIILAQIENEYGSEVKQYGAAGKSYVNWAAKKAVGLNTGVPWANNTRLVQMRHSESQLESSILSLDLE